LTLCVVEIKGVACRGVVDGVGALAIASIAVDKQPKADRGSDDPALNFASFLHFLLFLHHHPSPIQPILLSSQYYSKSKAALPTPLHISPPCTATTAPNAVLLVTAVRRVAHAAL